MKTISIGKQDFASLREQQCFYVDKTEFIREWWESKDEVTLITRPRRFGKTLNMSMLDCFFSNRYAGRVDLFEGLSVWEDEKYRELQGTYPVLFLTFADIKSADADSAVMRMKSTIAQLYEQNSFLLEDSLLSENEEEEYKKVGSDMPDAAAQGAVRNLAGYLSRYYGKKVIIILDEYDTPLQEAYLSGYWDEIIPFIRGLFNSTFKTNPYLERGIMTGITRVSKESMFSDLNNLTVVTTTSKQYMTAFGFTEEEVFSALDEAGMSRRRDEVKAWYDGFTFGISKEIYNPWSITSFLKYGELATYWADTSSNGLVSSLVQKGTPEVKTFMEELLKGNSIRVKLDEQIVFNQLDRKKNAIWSLLLASGYLKVDYARIGHADGKTFYDLSITNREVRIMFETMISDWFETADVSCNDFIKALLMGDIKAMNYYMNKVALATFSYFDTGNMPSGQAEPERFYHGFVLGLMVDQREDYRVISNRESGFGRYDVVMEPKNPAGNHLPAIVMEFKVHDEEEEKTLKDTVKAAHKQMEDKQYDAALLAKGIPAERIHHYGFAFQGKKVLIG